MDKTQQLTIRNTLFEAITQQWPHDINRIKPKQMYQAQCLLAKASEQFTTAVKDQCTLYQMIEHVYGKDIHHILTHKFMDQMQQHSTLALLKHTA
jgi:hypothetical protein